MSEYGYTSSTASGPPLPLEGKALGRVMEGDAFMNLGLLNLRPGASREEIIRCYNDAVLRLKKYVHNQDDEIKELKAKISTLEDKIKTLEG